ncbi:hypothetical protein DSECCO2_25610 [anaerobic digester metagenome]
MTMFTRPRVSPIGYHESTDWLRPSFTNYLVAAVQDGVHGLAPVELADLNQMAGMAAQSAGISMDYDETGFPVVSYSKQSPDIMDTEAQAQRIKEAGLEKELKPEAGYRGPMLDVIIKRKQAALERKTTRAAAPDSWAPVGLALEFGISLLDPINFVPIVPEARAMSLLANAGTGFRRAAVRGGIGAVEGAAGAAIVEPLTALTKLQEQEDYGLVDSLSNIIHGAVTSAALNPVAGAAGEWLRAKAGMRRNWEFAPSTPDTMALKDAHAKDIFAAREAATPEADKARLGQESQAAAALFDARSRAWAYDMQRPVSEYYERWRPDYTTGIDGQFTESALTHAMYRNRAESLQGFVDEVLEGSPQDKKSFKGLGTVEREEIGVAPSEIILASDQVRHISSGHPDFARWADIPDVLARGEIAPLGKNKATGGQAYAFRLREGEKDFVVVAAPQEGKNLGKRLVVLTAFQDNPTRVENWIKENKGAAFYQSAGGSPAYPSPEKGDLSTLKSGSSGENIILQDSEGKSDSPRAAVNFDADGKSVVQFFGSSDFSSAPHELYHVFRREMEQTTAHPDAPARVREAWDKVLEFAGAEPGTAWTREMEEKFAKAGERFLLEGKAPSPALQDVFERMRQWFLELYASADASGLDISDDMRTVFGNMLSTPMKDGDAAFRHALGSLMVRSFAEDAETRLPKQPELAGKPLEVVQSLGDEAMKNLDALWRQTQEAHPELKDTVGEAYRKDVSIAEAEAVDAARRKKILDEIARGETRH